jgi:hypothetical protein
VSPFDDFIERLEATLADEEGREAFVGYLQEMSSQERGELLAEAERRDPEGGAEAMRGMLDPTEMGRDAQSAN